MKKKSLILLLSLIFLVIYQSVSLAEIGDNSTDTITIDVDGNGIIYIIDGSGHTVTSVPNTDQEKPEAELECPICPKSTFDSVTGILIVPRVTAIIDKIEVNFSRVFFILDPTTSQFKLVWIEQEFLSE